MIQICTGYIGFSHLIPFKRVQGLTSPLTHTLWVHRFSLWIQTCTGYIGFSHLTPLPNPITSLRECKISAKFSIPIPTFAIHQSVQGWLNRLMCGPSIHSTHTGDRKSTQEVNWGSKQSAIHSSNSQPWWHHCTKAWLIKQRKADSWPLYHRPLTASAECRVYCPMNYHCQVLWELCLRHICRWLPNSSSHPWPLKP